MHEVRLIPGMRAEDFQKIMTWTNAEGEDFLRQYAGNKITFPLTDDRMLHMAEATYSIFCDDEFAGMLQVIWKRDHVVHIGRFMVRPGSSGKGIGSSALRAFCDLAFVDPDISAVSLNVYRFNTSARHVYEKCGFVVTGEDPGDDPWSNIHMQKARVG